MDKTDPGAATHRQQSMVIVPADTPGVEIGRNLPVFGHLDQHGHCEVEFTDVRVPVGNLLGEEGGGFANAQARLGPGRIHHVMRALGAGERALALMVARSQQRRAFGGVLAEQSAVRERIAESRVELEQARALCHRAAHRSTARATRRRVTSSRPPRSPCRARWCAVIDRAIQLHGGAGVTDATVLSKLYAWHRAMRIFDRPRRGAPDDAREGRAARTRRCSTCPRRGTASSAHEGARLSQGGDLAVADVAEPSPSRGQLGARRRRLRDLRLRPPRPPPLRRAPPTTPPSPATTASCARPSGW